MSASSEQEPQVQHNGAAHPGSPKAQEAGTVPAQTTGDAATRGGSLSRVGETISKPVTGATITGAIVLGAASIFGVVEALVGVGAAYGVYLAVNGRRGERKR
jgi:hypothetical protein